MMDAVFSGTTYVLRRQGLALAGKYRVLDPTGEVLMYVEEKAKWFPPSRAVHIYTDEPKLREVITLTDATSGEAEMDVVDAVSGDVLGGLSATVDNAAEIVADGWEIVAADGTRIAKIAEAGAARTALRQAFSADVPQAFDITVGEDLVGTLRQKLKAVAYELEIDLSADVKRTFDPRLAIASAVWVAMHQETGA